MLRIENLSFNYGPNIVFDNQRMTFEEDRIYGLLGKNGTGKSTLLYLIAGLLKPTVGSISLDEEETWKRNTSTLSKLFLVPDEFELPDMKIGDFIDTYAPFYKDFSKELFEDCLHDFGVTEVRTLKGLSLGQKKKIYVSFAIATRTKVLLLDEPTNGLDIPSKDMFRKVIAKNMTEGQTVIISTHLAHDVDALLDGIVIIREDKNVFEASTSDISERYLFENRSTADDKDVLYSEPSPQGYSVVAINKSGRQTQVDLSMLFKAVDSGKIE